VALRRQRSLCCRHVEEASGGAFLNALRGRNLLRGHGVTVIENTLRYSDSENVDEIFSSGNFAKAAPVIRIDRRQLQLGPYYTKARKLYWEFAHAWLCTKLRVHLCDGLFPDTRQPKRRETRVGIDLEMDDGG
jgi:hypothetical protein